jgi:hypothetical protein
VRRSAVFISSVRYSEPPSCNHSGLRLVRHPAEPSPDKTGSASVSSGAASIEQRLRFNVVHSRLRARVAESCHPNETSSAHFIDRDRRSWRPRAVRRRSTRRSGRRPGHQPHRDRCGVRPDQVMAGQRQCEQLGGIAPPAIRNLPLLMTLPGFAKLTDLNSVADSIPPKARLQDSGSRKNFSEFSNVGAPPPGGLCRRRQPT